MLFGIPHAAERVEYHDSKWTSLCSTRGFRRLGPALCPTQTQRMDRSQQPAPKTAPKEKSADQGANGDSLTGCVDEQEGQWVLVNDQTMAVIANLAADGFPTEAFAKHMGHKVTVRGTCKLGRIASHFQGSQYRNDQRHLRTPVTTCRGA